MINIALKMFMFLLLISDNFRIHKPSSIIGN